jgi:hypothetical protein
VSWGWEAETRALGLSSKEFKENNAQLLEKIKLCLAEEDESENTPTLPEGISAEDVVQYYLEGISSLARQRYAEAFGAIDPQDFRW